MSRWAPITTRRTFCVFPDLRLSVPSCHKRPSSAPPGEEFRDCHPDRDLGNRTHDYTLARTADSPNHWELDDFGFLRSPLKVDAVQTAISAANECAVMCSNIHFYERFKVGRASRPFDGRHPKVPVVQEILDWLANAELPPKLVFHAGTPKTGTTALQFCLALESRPATRLRASIAVKEKKAQFAFAAERDRIGRHELLAAIARMRRD
jgi:hypothetical protein